MTDLVNDNPTLQEEVELVPRIVYILPPISRTSENTTHTEEGERVPRLVIPLLPTPCGEKKKTTVKILLPYEVDPQLQATIEYTPSSKPANALTNNEYALRSLIRHQRFRQPNWCNIRYAEVKDQFQASPGFCALKPNALLSGILTPDLKCNAILSRFDLTLGAVLNGLLKGIMIFYEIVNNMPDNMKQTVGRAFITVESKYMQKFNSLVQYICGRRQELIQQRRELYKPPNKILKEALYKIPPSETHLFEDEAFKQFVEQVGGIDKLFPPEERHAKSLKRKANENQWYGNKRRATQNHQ